MAWVAWLSLSLSAQAEGEPLRLHPENPHYFLFRGKPAILLTSGEHYGAVVNADFDYIPYLNELQARGFNLTRTFAGVHPELPGSFSIPENTLAPAPGRFLCPWARSSEPGYVAGGNKFDLSKWDDAYFARLKDFIAQAGRRGIVVELVLFNTLYNEGFWNASPLNAKSNVNGVGNLPRMEAWSLKHPAFVAVQEAMVRKVVEELRDFDNLYYEVINEPYERKLPEDWQRHIAATVAGAEKGFRRRHLIAQNVGNGIMRIPNPDPHISLFNYHYASPTDAVAAHYGLNRAIGFNETGGRGQADLGYRTDGWAFLLAGGALYNHLDYSFSVRSPEGKGKAFPGHSGGGPAIRRQLEILKGFVNGFDFVRMRPDRAVVRGGVPPGADVQALAERGQAYAVHVTLNHSSSARWTGSVVPKASETVTFHVASNDGARLWVDDALVVDHWVDYGGSDLVHEKAGQAALEAGRRHALRIEYYDRGGNAAAKLSWSSPTIKKDVVAGEFKGEFFAGTDLSALRFSRADAKIDFSRRDGSLTLFPREETRLELALDLPAGRYAAEWVDTKTGGVAGREAFAHAGGVRGLASPAFTEDIALRVKAEGGEVLHNGIQLAAAWPPRPNYLPEEPAAPRYLRTPPAVIPIDVGRQLFVDDFLIAETTLKRTYHRAEYHPASPVLRPDQPWELEKEGGSAMPFSDGVWWDPKDQLFKLWYKSQAPAATCYAVSKDGIRWEKPILDVVPGTNAVQKDKRDSCTVWLDHFEKDPARRFKMWRASSTGGAMGWALSIHVSPDGIHWSEPLGRSGWSGDRSTVFYNPFRGVWVYSLRDGWSERPRRRRYWEARDFVADARWERGEPPLWAQADALDPPREDLKMGPQLYNLDCTPYESLLLGLFAIWRGQPEHRQKPNDLVLGYSRDGWSWHRPDRRAFCPVSERFGDWNYSNVQSAGGGCLVVGDKLYFYVSARSGVAPPPDLKLPQWTGFRGTRCDDSGATPYNRAGLCTTGLAVLRRDGFASMDGTGTLTTRAITYSGKFMNVNLDAPDGELRVEVLGEGGVVAASNAVKGDRTLLPVPFDPDLSAFAGKPVRFRFHLTGGRLYSFWVSADESGASRGYVAAGGPGFTGPADTVGVGSYR